jgi:hypothetical protein
MDRIMGAQLFIFITRFAHNRQRSCQGVNHKARDSRRQQLCILPRLENEIPTYEDHRIRVKSLYLAYVTTVLGVDTRCLIFEGWKTRPYVAKMGQRCLR